jgi:ActR/RegA family two-component response regulator
VSELSASVAVAPLGVLIVSDDPDTRMLLSRAIASAGDHPSSVLDLADAVALAVKNDSAVAFVDVTMPGGSGVALVHHLQAVRPDIAVYVMCPPAKVPLALEAMALGAAGMITLPASGDSILRATSEVRERRAAMALLVRLEKEVLSLRKRTLEMQRLTKLVPRATSRELVRAAADAFLAVSGAKGLAIFLVDETGHVLASQLGESALPERLDDVGLEAAGAVAHRELLPIGSGSRRFGTVIVDRPHPDRRAALSDLVTFVASLFAIKQEPRGRTSALPASTGAPSDGGGSRARFEPLSRFEALAAREVEKARRHRRKLSIAALAPTDVLGARTVRIEDLLLKVLREGDVLGRDESEDEVLLLLPDTSALGAQLCRRRIGLGAFGLATFPDDGPTIETLLHVARTRREEAQRSVVRALNLAPKGLREIVDSLLACPLVDAGLGSPYPLILAIPAAHSLVLHMTYEARRRGPASILVTSSGGMAFASAVREACAAPGEPSTVTLADLQDVPGCEAVEVVVIAAEHGTWACCGVAEKERFFAAHAADAMLADLLVQKLSPGGAP